jgi:hypothetical protein
VDRPVETELAAEVVQVPAVRVLLQHELDDVAGNQAGQCEDEERRDQERRDGDEEPLQGVALHLSGRARRP